MIQKVKIRDIATFVRGVSYKKDQAQKKHSEGYTAILRANNIYVGSILLDDLVYVPSELISADQIVGKGDIVITMSSGSKAHVGKVAMANGTMNCAFGAFCGKLVCTGVLPSYLFYLLMSKQFRNHIESQCKGTNINNIKQGYILDYEVVLPERMEQERIVAWIEELFSELDNGVDTLQKTKRQLAVYRQAVLKQAFDTKDTETVEISQIVDDIRIGPFGTMLHKSDYISDGIPVINPQHIKNNAIVPGSNITISVEKAEELSSYKLRCNDIVMGRRGEMGRCAAVTENENGWICGTGSIVFRLKADFDATFYAKILSSPDVVHYLEDNATGTTMKNLNEEIVKHIPVPCITRQQQKAISQKINAALSVCDSIEKTVDTALQQAEAMRQSMLKQAFEGRL